MTRPWRVLPLVLLLSGCGMYGSLYLDEETDASEVTEQPPIADEEQLDEREEREDDAAGDS